MPRYEYKVVPAPKKPGKIKGVKGTENLFAAELAGMMNKFGADGWEYQRTDTLPCEERHGLRGRTTTFQNMLIFRRNLDYDAVKNATAAGSEPMSNIPKFRPATAESAASGAAIPALRAVADAPEGRAPEVARDSNAQDISARVTPGVKR